MYTFPVMTGAPLSQTLPGMREPGNTGTTTSWFSPGFSRSRAPPRAGGAGVGDSALPRCRHFSFYRGEFLEPSLVPPSVEWRLQPCPDDIPGHLTPHDALAEGQDVCVVVSARQPGRGDVVAQRAADPRDFVGHHGLPIAGPAEDDTLLALAPAHGLGRRGDKIRVIHRVAGVRTEIPHFVTEFAEEQLDVFL